jgi:hypothetical protein
VKKLKQSKLSSFKQASTRKKILIGGGIAVAAVAAGAGGLYLAKRYKKGQQGKLLDGSGGKRDISSLSGGSVHPALIPYLGLQENKAYLTNTYPVPLPDAVTIGLGWDSDYKDVNLDLLASAFDYNGKSIGYVQGSSQKWAFNGGLTHSGDDVQGSSAQSQSNDNTLATLLGDNEHITVDFRLIPPEAASIVVGVLLVSAPNGVKDCYVNVLPLLRADSVPTNAVQVEYDSDEGESSPAPGSRGIGGPGTSSADDEDDELILLYKAKLEQFPNFIQYRGFISTKFERTQGGWQLVPIRQVVGIDQQYGLWPSMEHYAKPQQYQQYGQYPQ